MKDKDKSVNEFQEAISVLMEAYKAAGGRVFARRLMEVKGRDEVKQQLEAADFLGQILQGTLKDKDENDLGDDYREMLVYVRAINVLMRVSEARAEKAAERDESAMR